MNPKQLNTSVFKTVVQHGCFKTKGITTNDTETPSQGTQRHNLAYREKNKRLKSRSTPWTTDGGRIHLNAKSRQQGHNTDDKYNISLLTHWTTVTAATRDRWNDSEQVKGNSVERRCNNHRQRRTCPRSRTACRSWRRSRWSHAGTCGWARRTQTAGLPCSPPAHGWQPPVPDCPDASGNNKEHDSPERPPVTVEPPRPE